MNESLEFLTLLGFAAVTGIRHGIDLDHIAAITDIVGSQKKVSLGFLYTALYALGHGLVVVVLGIILLIVGQSLPESIDAIFGKIVGVTLITLGIYVLFTIFKERKTFKIKSKWMLIFDAIRFGYQRKRYGPATATGIGMIHGVGAETPTQVSAFLVLLGIGAGIKAILFLLFFVLGIFISNLLVAGFSIYGYRRATGSQNIYITIGLITAIFSVALGISFLI